MFLKSSSRAICEVPLQACLGARFLVIVAGVYAFVFAADAVAQQYPARLIRLVVGYAPGGSTDVTARSIVQRLTENLGQQVVIDNRPGANGIVATEITAKAPADGYTILMANVGHTVNPALYSKLPYDTEKAFAGVSLVAMIAQILVVHPSIPARNVKDLVRLAKSRPGQLTHGSGGVGSSAHMAMELLNKAAGIDTIHVPYKSGGLVVSALLGGEIGMAFISIPAVVPYVKAGRLRSLAVTSAKRSVSVPDVPTIAESGYPGFSASGFVGLVVPTGTAQSVLERLHEAVAKTLELSDVQQRFLSQGLDPIGSSPKEFDAYIRSDLAKWRKLIRNDLKLTPQ